MKKGCLTAMKTFGEDKKQQIRFIEVFAIKGPIVWSRCLMASWLRGKASVS